MNVARNVPARTGSTLVLVAMADVTPRKLNCRMNSEVPGLKGAANRSNQRSLDQWPTINSNCCLIVRLCYGKLFYKGHTHHA